jgi:Mn-containing catalase
MDDSKLLQLIRAKRLHNLNFAKALHLVSKVETGELSPLDAKGKIEKYYKRMAHYEALIKSIQLPLSHVPLVGRVIKLYPDFQLDGS